MLTYRLPPDTLLAMTPTTLVHRAATYQTGDADVAKVEVTDKVCACGGQLKPLCGKLIQGVMLRWEVWIDGNYEHVARPEYVHVPNPVGDWNGN